jgi:two-component system, OmpR family, sensor histidine kinase BaeS
LHSLRSRLVLSHLIPVLLVTPLVAAGLLYVVQTQLLIASVKSELTSQARLLAQLAFNDNSILVDPSRAEIFLNSISPYLTSQVMILTPEGFIVASSDVAGSEPLDTIITMDEYRQVQNGKILVHTARDEGSAEEFTDVFVPVLSPSGDLIGIIRLTNQLSGLDERFAQIRRLVLWIIVAGLGFGMFLGILLAWQISKPIQSVTKAVEHLTQGQNLEPLPEKGPTEIQSLEIAFNSLVTRLRSLEDARRQLLANLVHELGRPLGALRSAIKALQAGAMEDIQLRNELLDGMDDTTGRLQRLLEQLATLHGQVLGTLELNRQAVNLVEWLPLLLAPYRQSAESKGLIWNYSLENDLPVLQIDPDRIAQAIQNLVINAIQFSQPGKSITIQVEKQQGDLVIHIRDEGPGIPVEEQELIWKPFYRGSNRGRFPQGMGLGLSIARQVVEAHGGSIELNCDDGQGCEFAIKLPC